MPGAFEASPEFDHDPLRTAAEIQRSGEDTLEWLITVANTEQRQVDVGLIEEIHRRWFETTFPVDAGARRTSAVTNRKGTAAPVEGILPSLTHACENWRWRRESCAPNDEREQVAFAISEANTIAVAAYDIHPFIDGHTRTTWHLRNYVLVLDGFRPLIDLDNESEYEAAWWASTPLSHDELDRIVAEQLARDDQI